MRARIVSSLFIATVVLLTASQLFAKPLVSTRRAPVGESVARGIAATSRVTTIARNRRLVSREAKSEASVETRTMRFSVCSLFGSGDISPCNEVGTEPRGAQTKNFTVTNNHSSLTSFSVSVSCSGAVTACTITPASASIAAHGNHLFTAHFTMGSGTGHLVAAYESGLDDQGQSDNVYTAVAQSVAVTPKGQAINALASTPTTQAFTVTNTASGSETFSLSTLCTGSVTGCSVSPTSATIGGGSFATATATFTPGASGTTATIKVIAKDASYTTPADTGSVNETAINNVLSARAPVLDIASVNPGTTVDRNLCLTIAAGPNAASECGALRIVHPLRSVRTLNKVRTPTLIYSSAQAQPLPIVEANVTLDSLTAVPDTIVVVLKGSAGQGLDSVRLRGSAWGLPQTTRRVALRYSALANVTDLYKYTVEARGIYNGSSVQTATAIGQLIVVNRSTSEFGAGWWLAGLERLYLSRTDTILWVGGDGSARVYTRKSSTVFAAPNVDHPDSIVKAGTTYIRYLPNKLRVQFDATTGYHMSTINRLGHTTQFGYSGGTTGLLTSITVPPGTAKRYTFSYTAANKLDTISNPGPGPQGVGNSERRRRTKAVVTGTQLLSLRDCDGGPDCNGVEFAGIINFTYVSGTNLLKSRNDRLGILRSYFYDSLYQVSRDSLALSLTKSVVTRFRNADSVLRASTLTANALPVDSVYVRVDGPRPLPTQDYTFFWLDRFGAPRRIRNAVGDSTIITADAFWPGLAARVRHSSGQVVKAWYNSRALVDSATDSTHYSDVGGTRRFATTRMVWDPAYEGATKITLPEGEETHFSYDPTTGNRLWQYAGPDTTRIVRYTYNASGLLIAIQTPLVTRPQSFGYDNILQNLGTITTPRGYPTTFSYDSLGRLTGTASPIDSVHTLIQGKWLLQATLYDGLDRDTLASTSSPTVGYTMSWGKLDSSAAQTITIEKQYDEDGSILQLSRRASDEPQAITDVWSYDAARRPYSLTYATGYVEHRGYDEAGDVISDTTRRGDVITSAFDAENRLTTRIMPALSPSNFTAETKSFPHYGSVTLPADTETFAFDSGGEIIRANNFNAHIIRQFNPDGTIALDSTAVLSFDRTRWDLHNYALRYRYDLDGRRIWFKIPSQLAPRTAGGQPQDTMTYTYDAVFGRLEAINDVQGGQYLHFYDKEGRLSSMVAPGGSIFTGNTIETDLTYDDTGDGQLKRMYAQSDTAMCGWSSSYGVIVIEPGWIFSDDLKYDGRGKVTNFAQPDPMPGHNLAGLRSTFSYSGLGTLKFADDDSVETSNPNTCSGYGIVDPTYANPYTETFSDALGNVTTAQLQQPPYGGANQFAITSSTYNPSTLQLTKATSSMSAGPGLDAFTDTAGYNQNGDRTYLHRHNIFTGYDHWGASYYTADGKLYVVDQQSDDNTDYWVAGSRLEYKYDALGRRVQSYSRMDGSCTNAACRTNVVRSIWDGDRLLLESRYPADSAKYWDRETGLDTNSSKIDYGHFGRVLYTHGLALDEPEGMIRLDYGPGTFFGVPIRMSLFWNWRGLAAAGTFQNGLRFHCHGDVWQAPADTACVDIGWSGDLSAWMRSHLVWTNAGVAPAWEGSLIRQSADNSEQVYLRNRYYDPIQGRFTQEDPIGLAGGLNAYGFANGDPVNFSDPFGLAPCSDAQGKVIPCPEPEGGPRIKLPDGKNGKPNSWRPVPGSKKRPVKWVPQYPVPSADGTQPGASWDPDEGHYDVDGMGDGRRRLNPDGEEVDHDGKPVVAPSVKAPGVVVGLGISYWIISEALRVLFPPRNLVPAP